MLVAGALGRADLRTDEAVVGARFRERAVAPAMARAAAFLAVRAERFSSKCGDKQFFCAQIFARNARLHN